MGSHDEEVAEVNDTVAVIVAGDICFARRLTGFGCTAVSAQVDAAAVGGGFISRAIEGIAGIDGGAGLTVYYPSAADRVPATGLGAEVEIAAGRIGKEGIGANPALNDRIGDERIVPVNLSGFRGSGFILVIPENIVQDSQMAVAVIDGSPRIDRHILRKGAIAEEGGIAMAAQRPA